MLSNAREMGWFIGAADWGRDGRAKARRSREVPEKRARSSFRVGLIHDSSVRTYRHLFIYRKLPSRKLLCVAVRGSCGSRDVKEEGARARSRSEGRRLNRPQRVARRVHVSVCVGPSSRMHYIICDPDFRWPAPLLVFRVC